MLYLIHDRNDHNGPAEEQKMKKLNEIELNKLRALGYSLPNKNYWIKGAKVATEKELLEQIGYKWGCKEENTLHALDIIIKECDLNWTNAITIKEIESVL